MSRRDTLHRLMGAAILMGAGVSMVLHREVWRAHAAGPATGLEAALGLLTFALASLGLLLLIGGSRLRDGWKRDCGRAARRRGRRAREDRQTPRAHPEDHRVTATPLDPMAFGTGRVALATFLVMQARQAAARTTRANKTTTEKYEPGASQ